jgi:predicted deacylase
MTLRYLLVSFLLCSAAAAQTSETFCENENVRIEFGFDGADLDACRFLSPGSVELTFRPEDVAVFDAFSWFAFRVEANDSSDIDITLRFPNSFARFWPKLSRDGKSWHRAADDDVELLDDGKNMRLRVRGGDSGLWVSAQELFTRAHYDQWLAELATHDGIETSVIGNSLQGRPIHLAKTQDKPEAVLFLGRQHPAEVPGAMAMREFMNVVLGDSALARSFRARFTLLIIPFLNPDGVANGNSRHNMGGIDLNRDWGPFSQPETRSVRSFLTVLEESDMKLRLMLDFHATKMSPTMLFYTQLPAEPTNPELFAENWLGAVRNRTATYEFVQDARLTSDQGNSKNYFFKTYGIPAITYEVGDTVDRHDIVKYSPIFAEEMMRELLRSSKP